VMVCVVGAAGLGILLLAGTLKELVVNQRWVMYSLFIGLTLGGIPIVWPMARPATPSLIVAFIVSLFLMVSLAIFQLLGIVGSSGSNYLTLFLAGLAGASAMILPGLSGGYLLLLMGQYVPILHAIDQFKDAISSREFSAAMGPALGVLLPVGVGVLLGVVLVGNLLEWLLRRFRKATLGVLLGLLLGSTVGLWPFQVGVPPKIGDTIKGQMVTQNNIDLIESEDWKTKLFAPTGTQIAISLALIGLGFGITLGVSLIGGKTNTEPKPNATG
jgi:putative membrane protein